MSVPVLTPTSTISAVTLSSTGSFANVDSHVPYRIYSDESSALYSSMFVSGAVEQVSYVYKKLGGDILDIELTEGSVYSAYEEAVLEYSYILNLHQGKNVISSVLGNSTGSFDHKGNLMSGSDLHSTLDGAHVALKYPRFDYALPRRVSEGVSAEIGLKGSKNHFSASFAVTEGIQDYDLQTILDANDGVAATSTITVANAADAAGLNGDSFKLVDSEGRTAKFTFDSSTAETKNGTIGVNGVAGVGPISIAIMNAVNDSSVNLKITATNPSAGTVTLTQDIGGHPGNKTTDFSGVTSVSATNFTGGDGSKYVGRINGRKILITKVYYKTPAAMWRFFGYYGGLNVVGNLHNYGQFSDDSSFQLVPTWQNKQQSLAFEDAIYTRMSHYSYEIRNNSSVRLYPIPSAHTPRHMWVEFSVPSDVWESDDERTEGINNLNTIPLGNLPFENINSIGKQWIRRFALALCKETLGQVRSKFNSIPVPGDSITLNGTALITEGKDEQDKLRTELKETLAEMTYSKLAGDQAEVLENSQKVMIQVPNYIFVG